jgi:hypothetical protein
MAKDINDSKENDVKKSTDGANVENAADTGASADSGKKTTATVAEKGVRVLYVTAKRPSFRRAGIEFGGEQKRLVVSELTNEQIAQLKAEPLLVVVEAVEDAAQVV